MGKRNLFTKLAVMAAGLAMGAGLSGVDIAPVAAEGPGCGTVVTSNFVLQQDIGPCHEDGIIVAANNVTVDLNGHQVVGEGGANVIHQAAGVFSDMHTGVVV